MYSTYKLVMMLPGLQRRMTTPEPTHLVAVLQRAGACTPRFAAAVESCVKCTLGRWPGQLVSCSDDWVWAGMPRHTLASRSAAKFETARV